MRVHLRRLVLVASASLLAAACGTDDPGAASTSTSSSTSTPTSTPTSAATSTVLDPDDIVAPGDQAGVVNECAADDGGTNAADTFDEAGLALDDPDRLRFVPLDDPEMVTADEVTWLDPDDIVMGILHEGEAQAFPIDQMTYHHVANTTVAGEPYLVTY